MAHPMLKVAYQRGRDAAIEELPEDEHVQVKEAFSWRSAWQTARGVFDPSRLARVGEAFSPGGNIRGAIRGAAQEGARLTEQAGRNANLMAMAGKTGLGAGIGALAADEGQRGRGALIGAIGGLGAHAGMRYGGGAAIAKRMKGLGARAGARMQKGKLDPSQVQAWTRQQLSQGTPMHGQIRNRIGQALLGVGGGVGATAAASKALEPTVDPYDQYTQVAGFQPNYRLAP
jgi:hypothetical protein